MPSLRQLDRSHDAKLTRNERKLERELLAFFALLLLAMNKVLEEAGIAAARGEIQKHIPELTEILKESYIRSGRDGMKLTQEMLPEDNFSEETVLLALLIWAEKEAVKIAEIVSNTTLNIFDELVAENSIEGQLEIPVEDIIEELGKRNRNRGGSISTTESNNGIGEGQSQTAGEMQRGQVFNLKKSWRSQRDRSVRDSHIRADRRYAKTPILINENFEVGSGFGQYPLASTLPLNERIGCRCYTIYKKVKNI